MTQASRQLARLIEATTEVNGWSDAEVGRRARDAGHQFSKSWLSSIKNHGMPTLVPATLRALAAGLGLPVREVLRAALEDAGLPAGDPSMTPEQAIRADITLTQDTKDDLLAMINAARARRRAGAKIRASAQRFADVVKLPPQPAGDADEKLAAFRVDPETKRRLTTEGDQQPD